MGDDGGDAPPVGAAVRLGAKTALLITVVLGGLVATGALDPVQLLLPGQKGAGGAVMVEDFGADRIPDGYSYDGQQYYLAARYFPDVEAAGEVVGGPRFRLMRILLPALASPGGGGTGVVLLLVAWNIVGVGIAVAALADLAQGHGRPPVVGVAAAVALAVPLMLTTAECLAFGLALLALDLAHRHRTAYALVALAAAGLTRETALTVGIGLLALYIHRREWPALLSLPLAALPLVGWRIYLVTVLPDGEDAPLGFLDLFRLAERPTTDVATFVGIVVLGALAIYHWRDAIVLWPVSAAYLLWLAAYDLDTFDWRALTRVSALPVALGLACVADRLSSWGRQRPGTPEGHRRRECSRTAVAEQRMRRVR